MGVGGKEWIVVLLFVLLLFGGKKIPELMRGLGSGINEFKKATREDNKSEDNSSEKKDN